MGWQVGRLLLAMLVGQVALLALAAPAEADPASDARTLYCLEPENARPVAEAAVRLGTARAGGDADRLVPLAGGRRGGVTVEEWSRRDPAAFQRTCAALAAERELPDSGSAAPAWLTDLVTAAAGLLAVVVGAALSLVSALFTTGRAASARAAADLHAAAGAYYRVCRACLVAWRDLRGRTLEDAMDGPLDAFAAELRRAAGRHRGWRRPEALGATLKRLDREIREGDWPDDGGDRGAAVDALMDRLDEVHTQALEIAAALERPVRERARMRRP